MAIRKETRKTAIYTRFRIEICEIAGFCDEQICRTITIRVYMKYELR